MIEIDIAGRIVRISDSARRILDQYRQTVPRSREAGGLLLGEVSRTVVLVSRVSPPGGRDKRSRNGFLRDAKSAQQIVDHEHLNSGGFITYLGEWHTHPEPSASPSSVDLEMIKRQFDINEIRVEYLILLVLGQVEDSIVLYDGSDYVHYKCVLKRS